MASQYKSINGIKYERDLLDFAETAGARGRSLNKSDGEALWEKALDGGKVTPTERRTIEYIMENFKLNDSAKNYLKAKLDGQGSAPRLQRKGSSYYKTINGISYDRQLLEQAEAIASSQGGVINFKNALDLWGKANDGNGVTPTEKRTLEYIGQLYRLEIEAQQFLERTLDVAITPGSGRAALEDKPGFFSSLWRCFTGRKDNNKRDQEQLALENTAAPESKRRRIAEPRTAAATSNYAALVDERVERRPSARSPEADLCPELRELLISERNADGLLQLEFPAAEPQQPEDPAVLAQKARAAAEVSRILEMNHAQQVLGAGSQEDQKREFKRLVLLLHPDRGLVDHDDKRANLAYRLVKAAMDKSRAKGA